MAETRFAELLGLPEGTSDPDYYQLLGIDRSVTDPAAIEARFKEQMTRLQHIDNPRHKEFVEFLKGELKRARGILTDEVRRQEYDGELMAERGEELRKILSHMLVDGKLSSVAENSVMAEGRNLGLDGAYVRTVVDEELAKAGAKRVSSNGTAGETQVLVNRKAGDIARQVQEARLAARIAQTRAQVAEMQMRKAEEQAQVVAKKALEAELHKRRAEQRVEAATKLAREALTHKERAEQKVEAQTKKAREAEALARKAITREHVAEARERMSEQERRQLEERFAESERRLQAYVEASNEELAAAAARRAQAERLALSYGVLLLALVAGGVARAVSPVTAESLRHALEPALARVPVPGLAAWAPLIAAGALLVPVHLAAGRRGAVFALPLAAAALLALVSGLLRA